MNDETNRRVDLDLTPELTYETPAPRPSYWEMFLDMLDLIGGIWGAVLICGVYAMLLAPMAQGPLAAVAIFIGAVLVQATFFHWFRSR